jgi:uncharacterized protein (TIGR03435 family)
LEEPVRHLVAAAVVTALAASLAAQSPASEPRFQVVSIKPSTDIDQGGAFTIRSGTLTVHNNSMRALIRNAWNLNSFEVVGGPTWADSVHYDIVATMPGGVTRDQLLRMTQALLRDRFALQVHSEQRQMPVYALVSARRDGRLGPQIRKSSLDCEALIAAATAGRLSSPPSPPAPIGSYDIPTCNTRLRGGILSFGGMHLDELARNIANVAGRRVLDETGLKDAFDLAVKFNANPADGTSDEPSLFAALQEQLGLKLEPKTANVQVLVIDHIERPTEN